MNYAWVEKATYVITLVVEREPELEREYIPDPVPETDLDPDPTENRKIQSENSKMRGLFSGKQYV